MSKRLFDLAISIPALVVLSPVFVVIALIVAVADGLPILYHQTRIGRSFSPFELYKFRTMSSKASGPEITSAGDKRVTTTGRWLRSTKLDELPQLWNVVKGDMSLVGPRPEVPRYVEEFSSEFEEILTVRPGITGAASVQFRNESDLLATSDDPLRAYVEEVLPKKLTIEREYLANRSLRGDVKILAATVSGAFRG